MTPKRMPVLFVAHGGGPLPLLNDSAHTELTHFLKSVLGGSGDAVILPSKPKAILVVSAHWEAAQPTVITGTSTSLLFDYYGFPSAAYDLKYPCPGDPALAARVSTLVNNHFQNTSTHKTVRAAGNNDRGLDHGVFVPLYLMAPAADVPVVQLSLVDGLDPDTHFELGRALEPLRDEGVLIVGSGMSFHNMQGFSRSGGANPDTVRRSAAFDAWLDAACTRNTGRGRGDELAKWRAAPEAAFCHPREEHLIPVHVCAGAAGESEGKVLHRTVLMGSTVSSIGFDDK